MYEYKGIEVRMSVNLTTYTESYRAPFPGTAHRNQAAGFSRTSSDQRSSAQGSSVVSTYAEPASEGRPTTSGSNYSSPQQTQSERRPPFPEPHREQKHKDLHPSPPMMIPKEFVPITVELHKKLKPNSMFSALFFYKSQVEGSHSSHHQHLTRTQVTESVKSWKWYDPSYVRLPLSKEYTTRNNTPMWHVIEDNLTKFKSAIPEGFDPRNVERSRHWFWKTVETYNSKAVTSFNFAVVSNDLGILSKLMRQLPGIIDHALKLPYRLQFPIPILKRGESRTIYLSRNLVCSLLANAFLCTFPEQDGRSVPYFNFCSLFDEADSITKTDVKREKLKCVLKYFAALAEDNGNQNYPNSIISYERRCVPKKFNWASSSAKLSNLEVKSQDRLENNVGMLQVDFANKWVGGGVLNEGSVQEEIRFVISPELIIARLFTEPLDDDEVLVITGTSQYSSYTGYGPTFKCADLPNRKRSELDNLGREHTQVVAMDALCFKPYESDNQFREDKLRRELHKCYVAFIPGRHPTPVATGLWGCGCFNGDPHFKFLIQWMAASVHGRPVVFHTHNDDHHVEEFKNMAKFLDNKQVSVGKLFKILCKYYCNCVESKPARYRKPVFAFVKHEVMNGRSWVSSIF